MVRRSELNVVVGMGLARRHTLDHGALLVVEIADFVLKAQLDLLEMFSVDWMVGCTESLVLCLETSECSVGASAETQVPRQCSVVSFVQLRML